MRLIVIVKGQLPSKDKMDEDLKNYLSLNTYLEWNNPWFWERLRYALPHKKGTTTPGARMSQAILDHSDTSRKDQSIVTTLNHLASLTDREKQKVHVTLPPDIEMSLTPTSSVSSTVPFFPPTTK